tara:strand:+ start:3643 stop:3957 length:315 start_codon:yes stop_codon:yes gene_type:complete
MWQSLTKRSDTCKIRYRIWNQIQSPTVDLRTSNQQGERNMNWDQVEGKWTEFSGKAKAKWGKLTDDDVAQVKGNREALEGKIQAQYGKSKEEAKREVNDWIDTL